jgi:hypothetical protein
MQKNNLQPAMLRWTCRLRDVLERRRFCIEDHDVKPLSTLREAEFVPSVDVALPGEFDFEKLKACFSSSMFITLYDYDEYDLFHISPVDPPIRSLSGQLVTSEDLGRIGVLWLPPAVFISACRFSVTTSFCRF